MGDSRSEYIRRGKFERHTFADSNLYVFTKYLRANHFWIDDITFAHTCIIEAQDFLDDRFSGDLNFGRNDTLRQKQNSLVPEKGLFDLRLKDRTRQETYGEAFTRLHQEIYIHTG